MSEEVETWNGPFHRRKIAKGEYGELSKVREEVEEGLDALDQGQLLMFSVELADVVGALNGVTEQHYDKKIETYWERDFVLAPMSSFSKERYISIALDISQEIYGLCSDGLSEKAIKGILLHTVSLASYFNLDFEDLNEFAILRSRVARFAIENS